MTRFVLFVSLLLCAGLCAAQEAPVEAAAPPAPAEAAPTEAPAPEQPPAPVEPVPATPVEAAPVEVPAPEQPPVPAEPAPAAPAEPAAAETPAALETAEAPVETPAPAEQPEYLGHPLGLAAPTGDAVRVPDALFVDAREPEAYAQNHIAGAVNLPAKSLSEERNGVVNLLRPVDQLAALPGSIRVCCTHEYTLSNLRFARAVEPGNQALSDYSHHCEGLRARQQPTLPSRMALERDINPFLRVREAAVAAAAQGFDARVPPQDAVAVFAALRQWKNDF
ncbi:MAG TPA: hydroxyacylglutathione hydrolase C-terminal domain-containing protein [Candidatus Hydrogenedentes bacterium]|nr:hydroxyacylglutathione hydrolase C-terminal domain-containing protein [Candidatus Hydrogenedentota bacterium]